jgi:hypothetical protein
LGAVSQINAFSVREGRGAYVALSDVDHDGRLDIIAGAAVGATVKVFDGADGSVLQTETPFGAAYKGGIRVAGGDLNGDGFGDVVMGQGQFGSRVKISFGGGGSSPASLAFTAGPARLRDGVFLTTADLTGDGISEIIVGRGRAGNSGGASVGIFQFGGTPAAGLTAPAQIDSIALSNRTYFYGARVAAADINLDGVADILVGAGPMGNSTAQIIDSATGLELSHLSAFSGPPGNGVFTAASAPSAG